MERDERNTPPAPDDRDPHHELNNPADNPDPTEWPDPYDKRPDPRDGERGSDSTDEPFGDESHTPTGATSTSEPHHDQDLQAEERAERLERDKLDD